MASAALSALLAAPLAAPPAAADPAPPLPPDVPVGTVLPKVFCFRITDIREVKDDPEHDKFRIEFEVLNWTNQSAERISIALAAPDTSGVRITDASIDSDGRPLQPEDVNGDGTIDDGDLEDANQNGILDAGEDKNANGRLDNDPMPGNQLVDNIGSASHSDTAATWDSFVGSLDMLGAAAMADPNTPENATAAANAVIPGFPATTSIDATGAITPLENIDDGPNVRDGFVLEIDGLDVGETFQFNWFLESCSEGCLPIGLSSGGNAFGFGVVNVSRLADGTPLPGVKVFQGNSGVQQGQLMFFDHVYVVPDPALFAAEFGAGLTAAFVNPGDNEFGDAIINAKPVEETPSEAAELALEPEQASVEVSAEHCVTATVTDAAGAPLADQEVAFAVAGPDATTGTRTTDENGEAEFCFAVSELPGEDEITASTQGGSAPSDTVLATLVPPPTTRGCKVAERGTITTEGGRVAQFSGFSFTLGGRPVGELAFRELAFHDAVRIDSARIDALVCTGSHAAIFGQAHVRRGEPALGYRIDLDDGNFRRPDRYRIRRSDGYDSGDRRLRTGAVDVHD